MDTESYTYNIHIWAYQIKSSLFEEGLYYCNLLSNAIAAIMGISPLLPGPKIF
jgi:hypothetical protein